MQPVLRKPNGKRRQYWFLSVLLLGSCGCAQFMDTITSREFKLKDLWSKPPDPAVVLRDSTDGEMRGRALGMLKEPQRNGGNQEKQDLYVKVLVTAAVTNPVPAPRSNNPLDPAFAPGMGPDCLEPLVRLGAIRALGEYQDVRAHLALKSVFQEFLEPGLASLEVKQGGPLPFHDDIKRQIKMQALRALDQTGSPTAREVFLGLADSPGPGTATTKVDQGETNEQRLAALRGLARFHDKEVLDKLVSVLASETKNAAVRQVACDSLKRITGKNLPEDADRWRAFIQNSRPDAFAHQPSSWQRALNFLGN